MVSLVMPLVIMPVIGLASSVMVGGSGFVGGRLSTVSVKPADGIPVLPATSVAVAVNLCGPSVSNVGVKVQVPFGCTVAVPRRTSLSKTVIVAPGSPVPDSLGLSLLVLPPLASSFVSLPISPSAEVITGAAGGVVSIVSVKLPALLALPALSVAIADSACGPSLSG